MKKLFLVIISFLIFISHAYSQERRGPRVGMQKNTETDNQSTYDYVKAFETAFYNDGSTATRSASGKPGHKYWQNRADYIIDVELDTLSDIIMGKEIIRYTNNSPDDLDFLWLQMDQNLFMEDSRGGAIIPLRGSRNGSKGQVLDGGFKISAVQVISGKGRSRL